MPRLATGNVYERRGKWFARLTIGRKKRRSFMLAKCTSHDSAMARQTILAELAAKLRKVGRDDIAPEIIRKAASRDGKALDEVRRAVDTIAAGHVPAMNVMPTIEQIGKRWTSGELADAYPDRIKRKRSVKTDIYWLAKYVYPLVGDVAIDAFTLDHAETVMRSLPKLTQNSRRAIAQLMHRICSLAVVPLRHIVVNPLPPGFVPRLQMGRAKGWLYPEEDTLLMNCTKVPLKWRLFYGFLHREGMRRSEALRMTWSNVDLVRGTVVLDQNKTDEPRAWVLSPGVAAALATWRDICAGNGLRVTGDAPVFVDERGKRKGKALTDRETAIRYRRHLEWAGIARPELYEKTEARIPIRLHDSRATFITLALANGKTEAWVQDRTGHRSSNMINRYRRAARTAAELGLGECRRLDEAIPELRRRIEEKAAEAAPRAERKRGASGQIMLRSAGLATPGHEDRNPYPHPLPQPHPQPHPH